MTFPIFDPKPLYEPLLDYLLLGPWKQKQREILLKKQQFSYEKFHLKIPSTQWWSFCFDCNGIRHLAVLLSWREYWTAPNVNNCLGRCPPGKTKSADPVTYFHVTCNLKRIREHRLDTWHENVKITIYLVASARRRVSTPPAKYHLCATAKCKQPSGEAFVSRIYQCLNLFIDGWKMAQWLLTSWPPQRVASVFLRFRGPWFETGLIITKQVAHNYDLLRCQRIETCFHVLSIKNDKH